MNTLDLKALTLIHTVIPTPWSRNLAVETPLFTTTLSQLTHNLLHLLTSIAVCHKDSICRFDDGDMIKRGQRIAEWDPYTRPILSDIDGAVRFDDLVEGQSMSESVDESTGIAKRVVIDWRSTRGGADLRPAIVIKGGDGKVAAIVTQTQIMLPRPVPAALRRDHSARSGHHSQH